MLNTHRNWGNSIDASKLIYFVSTFSSSLGSGMCVCVCVCVCIHIYIYISSIQKWTYNLWCDSRILLSQRLILGIFFFFKFRDSSWTLFVVYFNDKLRSVANLNLRNVYISKDFQWIQRIGSVLFPNIGCTFLWDTNKCSRKSYTP